MKSILNFNPATITEAPYLPDTHGATWDNAADKLLTAGWRKLDPRQAFTPPDGEQVTGYVYWQDEERPDYAIELPVTAPIPEAYPTPEILVPRIDADGAVVGSSRLLADVDNNLIVTTDTASPQHSLVDQLAEFNANARRLRIERRSLREAARRAVVTDVDAMTPEDAEALAGIFEQWQAGEAVAIGAVREYDGHLYKVLQAHTTQGDWTPDVVPALWQRIAAPDAGPQPWVQPAGGHDAYQIGDRVTHNGSTWECTVANNVWEPGVHGWIQQ
jgi:hypothetical protein